jgi:hypothetical protein
MNVSWHWKSANQAVRVGLILATLVAMISLGQGIRNALRPTGSQDFQWGPSRALLHRFDPYALKIRQYAHPDEPAPFLFSQDPTYPISAYIFLWPYAALPWPMAKLLWALSNVGFMVVLVWGLGRLFLQSEMKWIWWLAGCLFVIGTPLRNLIGNGQHALFSLSFFVLALYCLEQEKPMWSGVCLALALLKYTVTLPLLIVFLLKRSYRPLWVAMAIHLALLAFASLWTQVTPLQLVREYGQVVMVETHQGIDGYVDINAVLHHLGLSAVPFLWPTLAAVLLLTAALVIFWCGTGQELRCLAVLSLLSTVVVYHRPYDMVVLAFALFYVLAQSRSHWHDRTVLLFGLCVLLTWFVEKPLFLLQMRSTNPLAQGVVSIYQWFVVALVYTALVCGFAAVYLRRSQSIALSQP